jgi:hypothetical protein
MSVVHRTISLTHSGRDALSVVAGVQDDKSWSIEITSAGQSVLATFVLPNGDGPSGASVLEGVAVQVTVNGGESETLRFADGILVGPDGRWIPRLLRPEGGGSEVLDAALVVAAPSFGISPDDLTGGLLGGASLGLICAGAVTLCSGPFGAVIIAGALGAVVGASLGSVLHT